MKWKPLPHATVIVTDDASQTTLGSMHTLDIAERVVLEHNAHEELIEMLTLLLSAVETPGDLSDFDRICLIDDASALLAKAQS